MSEQIDLIIRDGKDTLVVAGPLRLWGRLVDAMRERDASGAATQTSRQIDAEAERVASS